MKLLLVVTLAVVGLVAGQQAPAVPRSLGYNAYPGQYPGYNAYPGQYPGGYPGGYPGVNPYNPYNPYSPHNPWQQQDWHNPQHPFFRILQQYSTSNPNGYQYSYSTENQIQAAEQGEVPEYDPYNNIGTRARGYYQYVGDDGLTHSVEYTADENGFRPVVSTNGVPNNNGILRGGAPPPGAVNAPVAPGVPVPIGAVGPYGPGLGGLAPSTALGRLTGAPGPIPQVGYPGVPGPQQVIYKKK